MITTELLFGHGCLTWFDDDHNKFMYTSIQQKLNTTEAQGHHMLPSKKTEYKLISSQALT